MHSAQEQLGNQRCIFFKEAEVEDESDQNVSHIIPDAHLLKVMPLTDFLSLCENEGYTSSGNSRLLCKGEDDLSACNGSLRCKQAKKTPIPHHPAISLVGEIREARSADVDHKNFQSCCSSVNCLKNCCRSKNLNFWSSFCNLL